MSRINGRDAHSVRTSGGDTEELTQAVRLAQRMTRERLTARPSPFDHDKVLLVRGSASASLGAGTVALALVERAAREGLLTATGRGHFRPVDAPVSRHSIKADPRVIAQETRQGPDGQSVTVSVNQRESPLVWLRRHRGTDGNPLIDDDAFAAGERFRREVTRASLLPGVTMDWSRFGSSADVGASGRQDPHDTTLAARQRVHGAMDALGPDLAGFVLDTCGFLISLQEAERQRGWPARSGKLALRIAPHHLARHYGIGIAPAARVPVRGWQSSDARSDMSRWT